MNGFIFLVVMQVCAPRPPGIIDDMFWQSRCSIETKEIATQPELESFLLTKDVSGMGWIKVYHAQEMPFEIEQKTKNVERVVKESVVVDRKVKFK